MAEAILDYGPPQNAIDVEEGKRAFIWTMDISYGIPGSVNTRGNLTAYGNNAFFSSTTLVSPPQNFSYQCNYVLYAVKRHGAPDGPSAWQVVGYRTPRLDCI